MSLHNHKASLLSQADKDLARRSRWSGILYLVVFTTVLVSTPYLEEYTAEFVTLGTLITLAALVRVILALRFDTFYAKKPVLWRKIFIVATLLLAIAWGLLCMLVVSHYDLEWTAMLMLLIIVGIAAVAVTALSVYSYLVTSYLLLLLCPSIIATAYLYTKQSLAVMVMFLVYTMFMIVIGKRLNGEYWQALVNTLLLDQRAKQLEESNKELESYSYSIAHDLRAPLRSITAFSQILMEESGDRLNVTEKDYLSRVIKSGIFMADLIDDILELSRITRIDIQHRDINLSVMAEECLQSLQAANPERYVELQVQPDMHAIGDPRLMRIVLQNLLSNAWKFTSEREEPKIQVGTAGDQSQQVFFVKDNGVGFDVKYSDKVFGIFQRLHKSEEFEGTGIGLASVQRAIHRHGGKVWVNAKSTKGATFYFTLPDKSPAEH
ncbi:sensor histidine kinase [Kaarinaea lacus]